MVLRKDYMMQDFERDDLHLIVSEEQIYNKLNSYRNAVNEATNNAAKYEELDLVKFNKSVSNIEREFQKAERVMNRVMNNAGLFIDKYEKTKAGKFSKTSKIFLYKLGVLAGLQTGDYFSADSIYILLEPYNNSWYNDDGITKQEDAMLKQKYGEKYKESGKFIFLNMVTSSGYKPNRYFYYDKNLNVHEQSVKKQTYLSECKVGHLYENKNGKTYLCLPAILSYSLLPRWYDTVTQNVFYGTPTANAKLIFQLEKQTFYDYGLYYTVGKNAPMITVEALNKFVESSPYNATAFPVFMPLTEKLKKEISKYKTLQEIALYAQKAQVSMANVSQAGQMTKDLGIYMEFVPQAYVSPVRKMPNVDNLPDVVSCFAMSTLDTWIKKDVNKYRKIIAEFDYCKNRDKLQFGKSV